MFVMFVMFVMFKMAGSARNLSMNFIGSNGYHQQDLIEAIPHGACIVAMYSNMEWILISDKWGLLLCHIRFIGCIGVKFSENIWEPLTS